MFQNGGIQHRQSWARHLIVKLRKGRYSTYYQQRGDQAKCRWRTWGSILIEFRSKTISNEHKAAFVDNTSHILCFLSCRQHFVVEKISCQLLNF